MNKVVPETVGLSTKRLGRIKDVMQRYVDEGKLAGMITFIARHGKIAHHEYIGQMDTQKPMQPDAIFRIFSMTKPITSVALLMLYEEGAFQLSDPLSRFIPSFKDTMVFVGTGMEGQGMYVTDADREVTIHDLFTHMSGLSYGFEDTPLDDRYREEKILRLDEPLAEKMPRLARLPLAFQPGSDWNYSVSTDVLGHLVELISDMPFDEFLKQRIFEPLGMVDTDFYVPKEKLDRLAALYRHTDDVDLERAEASKAEEPDEAHWATMDTKPEFLSGGGGLVSTLADYGRFGHMLRNKGELDGVRLLGRKTVEFMTLNHLPADMHPFEDPGRGFGLGVGVSCDVARAKILGSPGTYGWGGAANTDFWIDPVEDMMGLLMLQFMPSGHYPVSSQFKVLAYQALVD